MVMSQPRVVKSWSEFDAAVTAGVKPETLLGLDHLSPGQQHHHHGNQDKAGTSDLFKDRLTVHGLTEQPLKYRYSHFKPSQLPSIEKTLDLKPIATPPSVPLNEILGPCFIGGVGNRQCSAEESDQDNHKQ